MARRATDFSIKSISIDSPRFGDKGAIDITAIVPEFNIFESLHSPYLTGDMMMVDTTAVSNQIMAQGQETVRIELYTDDDHPLVREFMIYTIRKQSKQLSASTSTYIYGLIEKHGFYSYFQRLNRSFSGNIGGIIYDIYKNILFEKQDGEDGDLEPDDEKRLLNQDNFSSPFQNIKVISPNMTPLAFCQMLTKRATTEYGEPFFLYSTLRSGPQLRSLPELMSARPVNTSVPYRFSPVYHDDNLENEAYRIISLEFPENDNSIALARAGAFGILYQSIDPFFKTNDTNKYQAKFDQHAYFNQKVRRGSTYAAKDAALRTFYDKNIYDDEFRIGDRPAIDDKGQTITDDDGNPVRGQALHELTSQIHSQVNTSFAFENFSGYDEEGNIAHHLHKVSRISELAFMGKRRLSAIVPGLTILNSDENKAVGRVFDLRIPSDKIQLSGDRDNLTDHKTTETMEQGLFLAVGAHHMFKTMGSDTTYTVSIDFSKLATSDVSTQPLSSTSI